MNASNIIATGFIADDAALATSFPSAGGDSSSFAFQAIYWRCIAAFAFSSRLFNPEARTLVFSNVPPPRVEDIEIGAVFEDIEVEVVRLDLNHRLPRDKVEKWGNVFYCLDIIDYCREREPEALLALFDSDVVLTRPIDTLFDQLRTHPLAGYVVPYAPDQDIHGLTPQEGEQLALSYRGGVPLDRPYRHFGGEILGVNVANTCPFHNAIETLWRDTFEKAGEPRRLVTEEHFWSVLIAAQDIPVAVVDNLIKRMWTSQRVNNVVPGDEQLAAWHLPAEKRFGFVDMFAWLKSRSFDLSISPAAFRSQAGLAFGVPRKSAVKTARDTVRRVRSRLFNSLP